MRTAVIYEGPVGRRVETEHLTITGTSAEDLVRTAREQVVAGADRIELCGGVGARDAARVVAALGSDVVGLNRYDFDSLEAIARYKEAFGRGEPTRELFVYLAAGADPVPERVEHGSTAFVGLPDVAALGPVAAELRDAGTALIELYGGLGLEAAAVAAEATGGTVPVGFVG